MQQQGGLAGTLSHTAMRHRPAVPALPLPCLPRAQVRADEPRQGGPHGHGQWRSSGVQPFQPGSNCNAAGAEHGVKQLVTVLLSLGHMRKAGVQLPALCHQDLLRAVLSCATAKAAAFTGPEVCTSLNALVQLRCDNSEFVSVGLRRARYPTHRPGAARRGQDWLACSLLAPCTVNALTLQLPAHQIPAFKLPPVLPASALH